MKLLFLLSSPIVSLDIKALISQLQNQLVGTHTLLTTEPTALDGVSTLSLPFPTMKVPKEPTPQWRDASTPLIDTVDAIEGLDGILLFDQTTLRAITATRVPKAPLLWMGTLPTKNIPLYVASALRLMQAIFITSQQTADDLKRQCHWERCDSRTLPILRSLPIDKINWETELTSALRANLPFIPAKIEHALLKRELPYLGDGSRRLCHRLLDSGLCVKFYRREQDFTHKTRPKVKEEIKRYAHARKGNTSCGEYDYLQKLIKHKPASIVSIFPDIVDVLYLPSFGWGLIETLIHNEDGSPSLLFADFLNSHQDEPDRYYALIKQLDQLVEDLCKYTVRFYDLRNIIAQERRDGSIRLRVADFEPQSRQLIPLVDLIPALTRRAIRRRYKRTFDHCVKPFNS